MLSNNKQETKTLVLNSFKDYLEYHAAKKAKQVFDEEKIHETQKNIPHMVDIPTKFW